MARGTGKKAAVPDDDDTQDVMEEEQEEEKEDQQEEPEEEEEGSKKKGKAKATAMKATPKARHTDLAGGPATNIKSFAKAQLQGCPVPAQTQRDCR